MIDGFLNRLPESATTERALVDTVLRLPGALKAKADTILANAELSPEGKARQIKELAQGDSLKHFRALRDQAKAMATATTNLKKTFEPKAPDRSDPVAEQRRAEVRNYVRSLPDGQRLRFVLDNPAASDAVLDQLPMISGLTDELFDRVKHAHIQAMHGPQLAGLAAREEVVAVVNSAVAIATREFLQISGLTEREIAA